MLLAGSVAGSYDGTEFEGEYGFVAEDEDSVVIILGDGNLYCGSENSGEPPHGHNVALYPTVLEAGNYGSVMTRMFQNVGSFEAIGANVGSLTLTSVTDETVSGEASFSYTDDEGRDFSFTATFEVVRCPRM